MPGTVRRTATGWLADVTVNGTRRTGLCKTKSEALARKRELLEALTQRQATPLPHVTLFSLKEARKLSLEVRWGGTAYERTAAIYSQAVVDHFGPNTLLTEITAPDVDAWRQRLLATGNRPGTINKKVSALKAMLSDAHLRGHIPAIPKLPQQLKLQNTKDRVISEQEAAAFCSYFKAIGEPAAANVLVFLLETCARWGELEQLRGEDVDLIKGRVTFAKTKANRVRSIPLTRKAVEAITPYLPAVGKHKVFPYPYWQYKRLFDKAKEALGLADDDQLSIHTTRHTCASKLAESGIPLHKLMAFGGWSSLASVTRYMHIHTDALADCVSALEAA